MTAGEANPVLVEVTRGGLVESRHRGAAAVVDPSGRVILSLGDIEARIAPRSAYKFLQALPLVASGAADAFALDGVELALACASHSGTPAHVGRVAAWLARLGLGASDLACGPAEPLDERAARDLVRAGHGPTRLHHNCSGKHAGFLTLARGLGVEPRGYLDPGHPVQKAVRTALAQATGEAEAALEPVRDGCGAPNFVLPLRALALGAARFATGTGLPAPEARAAARLRQAMLDHPEWVAGDGRPCTLMMRKAGRAAVLKAGAEGVYAAALPERGWGVALKIDDGASRAARVAVASLLVRLGVLPRGDQAVEDWLAPGVASADDVVVGHCRPAIALWPEGARPGV